VPLQPPWEVLATPPEAVAVVGASPRNFFAHAAVENLLRYGFTGPVLPVNPSEQPVLGLTTYADVDALPCNVQLGVVGVRASLCLDVSKQLAERGAQVLVVLSDGFGETGTAEGRELEEALASWCADAGIVLFGPNGVGYGDFTTSTVCVGEPIPVAMAAGGVSVVSQSGGMLSSILAGLAEDGVGVDFVASIGNGAGVDVLDALEICLHRDTTEVIAAYVEGLGDDVPRVVDLLKRIDASGKRLLALKPGRTATAQQLVMSHTATLAGPDAVVRSLLADLGVAVVDTVEQLVRTARLAMVVPALSADRGVAVLGSSGGAASVTSDMADHYGVPLPPYADDTVAALRDLVPDSGHVGNPIDLSGRSGGDQVDTDRIYGLIASDPTVGALLLPFSAILPDDSPGRVAHRNYLEAMAGISDRHGTPLVVSTLAGQVVNDWLRGLEQRHQQTVVVRGLDATMAALGALTNGVSGSAAVPEASPDGAAASGVGAPTGGRGPVLDEATGRAVLAAVGFPVVPGQRCDDDADLPAVAGAVGFPLVAKGVLPNVSHKAAVGGVVTGLGSPDAAVAAVAAMRERCRAGGIQMDGVLLERMVSGLELLVGLTRDPVYGPAVTVGLGGLLAETTDLHATAALPFGRAGGVSRLLDAAGIAGAVDRSGVPQAQVEDQLDLLCRQFVDGDLAGYQTVEVNPLFLTPTGDLWAADVLLIPLPD